MLYEDHDPGSVSLLHSVSHYASWMGRPDRKWDDRTFANRGDVSYGTAPLAVWDFTYLHLAPAIYVPSAAAIDTSLAGDPNVTLLGPYGAGDAGGRNHMLLQDCVCPRALCGLIVECRPFPGGILEPLSRSNC